MLIKALTHMSLHSVMPRGHAEPVPLSHARLP